MRRFICLVLLWSGCALAQQASWVVKPEWVKAHEEFLSSDALHGRGSATHDEELAAQYVAKEFTTYGLKPAPGMSSYIQSAKILGPQIDADATITIGGITLHEGADFALLFSTGESVTAPLAVLHGNGKPPKGSAILVADLPQGTPAMAAMRQLRDKSPAMLLLPWDESTESLLTHFGGKPRLPVSVESGPSPRTMSTILAVKPESLARLAAQHGTLTLTVHPIVNIAPRLTYNAIGYLQGSDPKAGTLLLTAHLDHLGEGLPIHGDGIWNGANDDAAGTTAVLELAHALAAGPKLRRSILFVCYGSEELGELGSTYFGNHLPVPLNDLVANLEFEMIGNQDPKMPKGVLLLTGWDRSNLGPTLKAHGALLGPDPYPEEHFFERSDNYQLALKGVVAHTAAGWGDVPTYHQPDDDMAHLDLPFMTVAIQSLVEPVRWLAASDFTPTWNPNGKPERN